MPTIHNVKLQLLRPGPAHNQLISPITPYIALCGTDGPVTLNLPFEHRHLLNRLARLRYSLAGKEIPAQQREAEARDIGEILGRVLGEVPALSTELANTSQAGALIHLRLSMSAFELGLVPFEFAIGMDGFPAAGAPLFLQSQIPITLTREVRRSQPLEVPWDRPARILFAFATPNGLPAVPAQQHLRALRRAIDPWVKWRPDESQRVAAVESLLTVLPNASLEKIAEACAKTEYTHVHILAHGMEDKQAGNDYYGVALCHDTDPSQANIVDGKLLAIALTAKDARNCTRNGPSVVSLATCDSGAVDSVVSTDGSIAHALHDGGIPWVFASQFPLWMRASNSAVEILYNGLLQGEDPRWVLYELRQQLYTKYNKTHDWASIVAYASVPENFPQQVAAFRKRQRLGRLEVKFDIADEYLNANGPQLPDSYPDLDALYQSIREDYEVWLKELGEQAPAPLRAKTLGIYAAAEKRIGLLYEFDAAASQTPEEAAAGGMSKEKAAKHWRAFKKARDLYKQAMEIDPGNAWLITQYLAMYAVLELGLGKKADSFSQDLGELWITARRISKLRAGAGNAEKRAEDLSTLAELELLGVVYGANRKQQHSQAKAKIPGLCQDLIDTAGADSFLVASTRRQFKRYVEVKSWQHEEWQELADIALQALSSAGAE